MFACLRKFSSCSHFLLTSVTLASVAMSQGLVPEENSGTDWEHIRTVFPAGRYVVVRTDAGLEAHNPGQGWDLMFDGRGFLVKANRSDWTWGLELVSYGFEGSERFIEDTQKAQSSADGERVTYAWDSALEEWYINDTRGVEHEFILHERPACEDQITAPRAEPCPLTFWLRIRGDLDADVQPNLRDVNFVDTSGATILTYGGLTVFDANDRILPAWFETNAEELILCVDEREATYPPAKGPA